MEKLYTQTVSLFNFKNGINHQFHLKMKREEVIETETDVWRIGCEGIE